MSPNCQKILEFLMTGEYSVYDLLMCGCGTEARHYISILRKSGYDIRSRWVSNNNKRYKLYKIER